MGTLWRLNLPASFTCNHRQAPIGPTALIRDPVQRIHQLGNLCYRVVRRHSWANMPKNVGNRLFPHLCLTQSHSHRMPQAVDMKIGNADLLSSLSLPAGCRAV